MNSTSLTATICSGILLGLSVNYSFGISFAFFLPFCLIGLFISLNQNKSLKAWLTHGFVFWLISLTLVLIGFIYVDPISGSIMVVLASIVYALPLAIVRLFCNKSTQCEWIPFVMFAFIWPPFEWFICELTFGFPITLFANALANYPHFIQYIDITGYSGISFWVIILNVIVYKQIKDWHYQRNSNQLVGFKKVSPFLFLAGWLALPLIYGYYVRLTIPLSFEGNVSVAAIQADDISAPQGFDYHTAFPFLQSTLALTDSVISQFQPDLVVWPEGALPIQVRTDHQSLVFITDKVLRWQTPIITGFYDQEPILGNVPELQRYLRRDYHLYNAVAMITPQFSWKVLMENSGGQSLRTYRKVHLMPFTEYVPLSRTFPSLSRFMLKSGENNHFRAGNSVSPLAFLSKKSKVVRTIPFICWDILFASTYQAKHIKEAQLITVHTSARLFGNQLTMSIAAMKNYAVLRSVELRKSLVNSSTTGYSFITNPFGEIQEVIQPFTDGFVVQSIPLKPGLSFYAQSPHLFPSICLIILGIVWVKQFANLT